MGCSSSTNVHPSIYNETIRKQQLANGEMKQTVPPKCINENSLRGDYTQYQLAKHNREKIHKDRQIKIFMAADEMSGKLLEEREMLSLGTRSRGTSRNTSRATSPSNTRRSVQFKDDHPNPMTPVAEDKLSRGASLRSIENGTTGLDKENVLHSPKKKHKNHKHSKSKSKNKKNKKSKKSKKGKGKPLKEINESDNDEDSGLEDEDDDDGDGDKDNNDEIDKSIDAVKAENEITETSESVSENPDTTGASTSVISKRSVNDIMIHSASDDSGIARNSDDIDDTVNVRTNVPDNDIVVNKSDADPGFNDIT
ncbi:hypothetical protein ACF0H5_022041 [Mactra antiquata]